MLPAAGGIGGGGGESNSQMNNAEEIPREELMALCMKMNKRMQAMENKGKELVKKKTLLLQERQTLFGFIVSAVNSVDNESFSNLASTLSTMNSKNNGNDLELSVIESAWRKWEEHRLDAVVNLEQKNLQHDVYIASLEARLKKEQSQSSKSDDQNEEESEAIPTTSSKSNDQLPIDEAQLAAFIELQGKYKRLEAESARLLASDKSLNEQLEKTWDSVKEKNMLLEKLQESSKRQSEEKSLDVQMLQKAALKSKEELKDKEREIAILRASFETVNGQYSATKTLNEEQNMSVHNNREMIQALQNRLMELEPELSRAKERIKDFDRHLGASTMMKVEQDALLSTLRKDLKSVMDERDKQNLRIRNMEAYRVKTDEQLTQMQSLKEQQQRMELSEDEHNSMITRLRSEAQVSERNHGMRTAMLATVEAKLTAVQKELDEKNTLLDINLSRISEMEETIDKKTNEHATHLQKDEEERTKMKVEREEEQKKSGKTLQALKAQHTDALDTLKKDAAKKSTMARGLLSEREEDVRILTTKVSSLQAEITSGAPSERRIFELAEVQARREAVHGQHQDTREIAFEQLQGTLAERDFELARAHQMLSELSMEIIDLQRTTKREGINMDYLKNIVVQYMSFPVQSSEKMSLVPVIAMLLQFNPREMNEVDKANREAINSGGVMSMWSMSIGAPDSLGVMSKPVKEVKRRIPLPPGGSSSHGGSSQPSTPFDMSKGGRSRDLGNSIVHDFRKMQQSRTDGGRASSVESSGNSWDDSFTIEEAMPTPMLINKTSNKGNGHNRNHSGNHNSNHNGNGNGNDSDQDDHDHDRDQNSPNFRMVKSDSLGGVTVSTCDSVNMRGEKLRDMQLVDHLNNLDIRSVSSDGMSVQGSPNSILGGERERDRGGFHGGQ